MEYLPMEQIKEKHEFRNFVTSDFILKNDFTGNITLNYIIDEINRLIEYNDVKSTKRNLVTFILEIMYSIFNETNYDIYRRNKELNNLAQTLYSSSYFVKMQDDFNHTDFLNNDVIDEGELTEEQINKIKDEKDDLNEELDALDIEEDIDMEDDMDGENDYFDDRD